MTKPKLDPMFSNRRPLRVAGVGVHYAEQSSEAFAKQWESFAPMIGKMPGQIGTQAYGVVTGSFGGADGFEYITGVEVSSFDHVPSKFRRLTIPAQRYAVFVHDGHVSKIRDTMYTIKKEWPELLGTAEAKRVAASTFEIMEFMEKLRRDKKLVRDFRTGFGKVAYHAACHLRAQKIGTPGARILGLLPDTEVEIVEKCSAVDGTWGMKAQYYEMGRRYAQKLVRKIDEALTEKQTSHVVTDCPLAGLRIAKENAVKVRHPVEALADAYGIYIGVE